MQKWYLFCLSLILLVLPVKVKALNTPEVFFTAPEQIICEQPFALSFHIENNFTNNSYYIKPRITNLNLETWIFDPNSNTPQNQWIRVYSSIPWEKLPQFHQNYGQIIIKTGTGCPNEPINLSFSVRINESNYYATNQELNLIDESDLESFQVLPADPEESITLNNRLFFLSRNQKVIFSGIFECKSNCTETELFLPKTVSQTDQLYVLDDKNIPLSVGSSQVDQKIFDYTINNSDCSPPEINQSYYEYQVVNLPTSSCSDHQYRWKSNLETVSQIILGPYNLSQEIVLEILGLFNHYQFQSIILNPKPINQKLVSEIYPFGLEWVEFYNSTDQTIAICNFSIDDGTGGGSPVVISSDCLIEPGQYKQIFINKSLFNNDADNVVISDSAGNILENFSYQTKSENASLIYWDKLWQWTLQVTQNQKNLFSPIIELIETNDPENEVVDNFVYKIMITDYKKYQNKKVEIIGILTEKSGNNWFITDNTGSVKVYFSTKNPIKKISAAKGSKLKIIGIVDLYRNIWRILPSEEIVLLERPPDEEKITLTSATTKTKTTAQNPKEQALVSSDLLDTSEIKPLVLGQEYTKTNPNQKRVLIIEAIIAILIFPILIFVLWKKKFLQ